jgi:hypothetical protein
LDFFQNDAYEAKKEKGKKNGRKQLDLEDLSFGTNSVFDPFQVHQKDEKIKLFFLFGPPFLFH